MSKIIKLTLPIYYTIERKTKKDTVHLVGQNWFRNIHHHLKNKVKQHYHFLVANEVEFQPNISGKFSTSYKLYYKSKVCDATNVISQVEKFALDGLIEANKIEEDNVLFHIGSSGWEVEEDKLNPRIEITIRSIE